MDYTNLIQQADHFLVHSYQESHHPQLCFRTMDRVRDIVNAAAAPSEMYKLNDEDKFVISCTAYFQDIGYLFEGLKGTQLRSISMRVNYRKNQVIDERIWCTLTLIFLRNHIYFTQEARMLKESIKKKNIACFVKRQIIAKQRLG